MKTLLKVVTTSTLALTIGIATSIEVKASTFPSIINATIDSPWNLTIDSNNFNTQFSLDSGGDIDLFKMSFNVSGNFNIVAKEIIYPNSSLENSFLGNNMSLFLFNENLIYMPLNSEQPININVNQNQNDIYYLGINNGRRPTLDSNNQLTGWVDNGPYTQALIPYNLEISSIPEPSAVLGLILFGFLGLAGSKKKLK